ncbi:hypothetical protein L195_g063939, partial [Trifolium pratense]
MVVRTGEKRSNNDRGRSLAGMNKVRRRIVKNGIWLRTNHDEEDEEKKRLRRRKKTVTVVEKRLGSF